MRRAVIFTVLVGLVSGASAFVADTSFAQNPSKGGAGGAQVFTVPRKPLTEAEKGDLKRVSDYLNTIKGVQGRFTQLSADGRSVQGSFYLRKPGRIRFEYD